MGLPKAFADVPAGTGWYVAFSARNMSTITQRAALDVIKEVLAPFNLDMSVSDAEYKIVIDVNPFLCGFSVLRHYEETWSECNLSKACRSIADLPSDVDDASDDDDGEDEDDEDGTDGEGDAEDAGKEDNRPADEDLAAG